MNAGTILIIIALILSLVSLYFHARGASGNHLSKLAARKFFYASGLAVGLACLLLLVAFIGNGFQYSYVYSYSSRDLPFFYRAAAFWAGQEGTFLLWTALLYVFGFFIIRKRDENESILIIIITITQIFLMMLLVIYSPFRYIWNAHPGDFSPGVIPPDGAGLNPLLQDFWMVIHPPVLFIGYASATIPFAYAIVALMKEDYTQLVFKAYRWVVFSVVMLGTGIFLGGYWAYKVLGWGGYWGWDPVENSSLIPWLTLIALMHGLILQQKKNALVKTNIFLALCSFILIFYSTFLTRSGVLSSFSVHSFSDLGLSKHLVFFILFYAAISLFLFVKRFRSITTGGLNESLVSWDTLTAGGIISICCYALLILIGTSMPLISTMFSANPFSVQQGYYNSISVPLGILILTCIALAGVFRMSGKRRIPVIIGAAAVSLAVCIFFNIRYTTSAAAYIFSAIALFIIIINVKDIFQFNFMAIIGSRLSHMGAAILVLGILSSSYHSGSVQKRLTLGTPETIQSITLTFRGITGEEKSSLLFTMDRKGVSRNISTPYYISGKSGSLYREPYIAYGLSRDIYISPVEYARGMESLTRVGLARNEEKTVGGMKILFMGFDVDREQMISGEVKLLARLHVAAGGKAAFIAPGIQITRGNERVQLDATVPFSGQRVSLLDFDVSSGTVLIFVEAPKSVPIPPDSVIVEVSFKRLIWLVWLGTVLIAAGAVIALRKK